MEERPEDFESPDLERDKEEPSKGLPWGGIIGTIGLILVVVFAVQNTETVAVRFLWMSGEFPLTMVILASAVGAAVFTAIVRSFNRRRRRRRRAEQAALRRQLEED